MLAHWFQLLFQEPDQPTPEPAFPPITESRGGSRLGGAWGTINSMDRPTIQISPAKPHKRKNKDFILFLSH